jgi:CheY-like chemotaxis protein
MLRAHGYTVLSANSGEECLRQVEVHGAPIQLLLVDVIMPGMNGREVLEQVTELRPDVRVLFMSGYAEDVIAAQGMLQPGVDFIAKPFSVESLTSKVREILDR